MTTEASPTPSKTPVITEARLKITAKGREIWDLYENKVLVGWTTSDPAREVPAGDAPFWPSCWAYGSGRHMAVALSRSLMIS